MGVSMTTSSALLLLLCTVTVNAVLVNSSPPKAVWPTQFQALYTSPGKRTHGRFAITPTAQRIDFADGTYDHLCSEFHNDTACTQLTAEGFRFLHFPEKKACCKCCAYNKGTYL